MLKGLWEDLLGAVDGPMIASAVSSRYLVPQLKQTPSSSRCTEAIIRNIYKGLFSLYRDFELKIRYYEAVVYFCYLVATVNLGRFR